MTTEAEPSSREYRLRELYPKYYLYLGALASISLATDSTWRKVYQERLDEIKLEIIQYGGDVGPSTDG